MTKNSSSRADRAFRGAEGTAESWMDLVALSAVPGLVRAVETHGPPRFGPRPRVEERFGRIVRSISGQQLSVTAASTIYGRVEARLGEVTAESVLAAPEDLLRGCGLSGAKVRSLRDLAARVSSGQLRLDTLGRVSTERAIEELVAVTGIGVWTAQMFLLGTLRRPDVWPTGDLGVRKGYALIFGLDDVPTPRDLEPSGDPFRPFRSSLAWYCWKVLDS